MSVRWQRCGTGNHDSRARIRHVSKGIGMSVVGETTGAIYELPSPVGELFAFVICVLAEFALVTMRTYATCSVLE